MKTLVLNAVPAHDLKQKDAEFLALNLMITSVLIAVFLTVMKMPIKSDKQAYRSINPVEYFVSK